MVASGAGQGKGSRGPNYPQAQVREALDAVKQNLKQLPSDNIARFVDPQTRKAFLEPWRQHCKAFDRLKNPSKAARETAASLKAFYHSQLSLFVEAAEEPGEAYEVVQKEFADFVDDWAQKEAMEKFLELGERGEERATGLPPKGKEEEEESERGSESAAKRRRPDATAESGKAAAKKSKTGAGKNNKKVVSSGSSSAAAGAAAGAAAQMGKGKTASKGKAWGDGRGEKRLTQRAPASDPATKAAKRKAGASVRSGTGAAVDVADDDGDLLQRFTATPASFAKQSAALEGAADIVRNAELAAGSDPAALKAALAMSRALVQGLDRLVRMGAEVVTALTTASESSSGATPTKFSGGRGSRNVLSKVTSRLDDLAVEMSLFPDAWEENGKTGVAVVLQEGNGRLVTEKQITGHVGKIRTHVATVVQNFVARQIGTAFPVYKERSDPTIAAEFATRALVFIGESEDFQSAKRDARIREVDSVARGNAHVLLSFAFRSGLVNHVMAEVFEGKRGVTLPLATFVVVALRHALIGMALSGRKFDVEKTFRELSDTLGSADGEQRFQDLVELHGDGKNAGDAAMVEVAGAGTGEKSTPGDAREAEEEDPDPDNNGDDGDDGDDDSDVGE